VNAARHVFWRSSRVWKIAGANYTYYINNAAGQTELVQKGTANSVYTYNIYGNDNTRQTAGGQVGQVLRDGVSISRYYYLKDHLGNVRMVVKSDGTSDAYNDYYPYGMQMPTRNQTASADARFKFTGKERDAAETGYDYFGARYYDSWRGQWGQVDALSPLHPDYSPYAYVYNNPTSLIDPFGFDTTLVHWLYGDQFQTDPVDALNLQLTSTKGNNNNRGGSGSGPSNGSSDGNGHSQIQVPNMPKSEENNLKPEQKIQVESEPYIIRVIMARYEIRRSIGLKVQGFNMNYRNVQASVGNPNFKFYAQAGYTNDDKWYLGFGGAWATGSNGLYSNFGLNFVYDQQEWATAAAVIIGAGILIETGRPEELQQALGY
jgi:RHS repeat-associated protein